MSDFSVRTITAAGAQLHAASLEQEIAIEFTSIYIGDGDAPAIPQAARELTHSLFSIPVSAIKRSEKNPAQTVIRGSFVNTGTQSQFWLREIGIMARLSGSTKEPILYAYFNAESCANFIPSVDVGSIVQQSFMLSVITGSANVLYTSDPLAPATIDDINEARKELQGIVDRFSEQELKRLQESVASLDDSLSKAREDLQRVADSYVNRSGDTMTGDLTMSEGAKINGPATLWDGWCIYSALAEIAPEINTHTSLASICTSMKRESILIARISESHDAFPLTRGIIEIRCAPNGDCTAQFTDTSARAYIASVTQAGVESGWRSIIGAAPGQGGITFAADPPIGWLACNGAAVSRATYAALFAAIGTTYGAGNGTTTFNLPDTRGLFLRGLDAGKGIDSSRKLGSTQQAAVPNITGLIGPVDGAGDEPTGAFYRKGKSGRTENAIGQADPNVYFNAARASNVYKSNINEVRPVNLAVNYIIKY